MKIDSNSIFMVVDRARPLKCRRLEMEGDNRNTGGIASLHEGSREAFILQVNDSLTSND